MPAPRHPRLPVAPLQGDDTILALARRLGVGNKQVHRWIAEGGIPFYAADDAACRLGLHPDAVWGRAYWDACVVLSDTEADSRAHQSFMDWLAKWSTTAAAAARVEYVRGCNAAENRQARIDRYWEVREDRLAAS